MVSLRPVKIIHISNEFTQFHNRSASASSKKTMHAATYVSIFARNSKLLSLKCVFSILHVGVADSELAILLHVAAPAARNAQETPNGTVGQPFGVASIIRRGFWDLSSECWRLHPDCRWRTSSVGGSAMQMKRPDDVGREAGSGPTPNWKELTVFRACP